MEKHPAGDLNTKAGLGVRFVAALIDGILIAVVAFPVMGMLGGGGGPPGPGGMMGAGSYVWPLLGLVYFVAMEAVYNYTIGKKALGLVVVGQDGGAIDWEESLVRNVLRIVDALPFFYLIGAILIVASDDNQRLGDMVGDTFVVKAR